MMSWLTTWTLTILLLTIDLSVQSKCILRSEEEKHLFAPTCPAGTNDGQYRYLSQIGEGSSSTVLVARPSTTNELVAIKVYSKKESDESFDKYIEGILSEFHLASQLLHPNIVRSIEVRQEDETTWLYAMEYCHTPLLTRLLSQRMSQDDIADVFVQVLRAMQYLHTRGIAHRDIKIHNVVMCSDGYAKLIDFGEAWTTNGIADKMTTDFVGTHEYIAPEMHDTKPYDPLQTDIWALGILFCALSLQEYPWNRSRVSTEAFAAFVEDPYNTLLVRLPVESRRLIGRMLEIEPIRRVNFDDIFDDPWIQEVRKRQIY